MRLHRPPSTPRRASDAGCALLALLALLGACAPAQRGDSRPAATRPSDAAAFPVTLAPPTADGPCPSHLPADHATAPELVVEGRLVHPLDATRPPVVDGDTLRVAGLKGSVRFIGLDAEETFKDAGKRRLAEADWDEYVKTETAGRNPLRPPKLATPMGMAAKSGLELLLKDAGEVRLEYDDPARKTDGYDRLLAHVLVRRAGGWLHVNVEMVRQGWSPYFVKYGRSRRYDAAFVAAQAEARAAARGIWGPQAPYRHCGDYEVRLKWWDERARALAEAEAARARNDDVFLLGRAEEWERLKRAVGRRVTVVTTCETYREPNERLALLACSHANRKDFLVVGTPEDVKALDLLKRFEGDLVFLTGVVELYKGEPQFRTTRDAPVVASRTPPPATESRAASRP